MRYIFIFLFIFLPIANHADPVVYSSVIKGVTDQNGVYTQIFKKAFKEIGWQPKWVFLPPKRSSLLFKKSKEHCEIPGNLDLPIDQLIFSEPVNYAKLYAFTPKKSGLKINSLKELEDLNLVIRVGWKLGEWRNKVKVNLTKVETERQQYKMLMTKNRRIDSAVAFMPDFFSALSQKEFESLYYDETFVLNRLEDKLACFKSPKNQEIINKLNVVIRKYRKDGTLKKILGTLFVGP